MTSSRSCPRGTSRGTSRGTLSFTDSRNIVCKIWLPSSAEFDDDNPSVSNLLFSDRRINGRTYVISHGLTYRAKSFSIDFLTDYSAIVPYTEIESSTLVLV